MKLSNEKLPMDRNAKIALLVVTLAIFTDILIYAMIVPILPKYALELGASQQLIGLMFASYAITFLVATPLVGMISDRAGRRMPMICGLIGLLASTLLFANANDLTLLIVARSLQGISAAATWTAGLALLADIFPAERRQQVIGIALMGSFLGSLVGPGFGGFLFELGGYQLPFIAAGGLVVVDGIARVFLLKDPVMRRSDGTEGLAGLLKSRSIILVAAVVTLAAGVSGILEPTLPLYLQAHLNASPGAIGLLFAAAIVGSLIFSPISYRLSEAFGRRKVIVGGLALTALALPLLAVPDNYFVEVAVMALLGAITSIMLTSVPQEMTVIAESQGNTAYGALYSIYNIALSAGMMLGPIAGGILTGYLGFGTALIAASACLLAYVLILVLHSRSRYDKTTVLSAAQ